MVDHINNEMLQAEIEEERNALATSLSALAESFKPKALMDNWDKSAPEFIQKALQSAKDNPVAVAVIGAGIAMLTLGTSKQDDEKGTAWRINGEADPVRTKIAQAKHQVTQTAAQMRDALYDGTANLGDAARARVIEARKKALDAQVKIEQAGNAVKTRSSNAFDANPLAICAGVAAAGALIAITLPRTKIEDDTFGDYRDALVDQAEAVFRQEVDRVAAQGREAMDAAQDAMRQQSDTASTQTTMPSDVKPH
ncbi:Protein of unknown function [Cognatiyoonia koreensis]|uniref:DUF3618 domain-containing protein n=1 Tax=Cognatiyoonia koreensis TaxID=364200 RepID=A0A1I0PXZ8_9RHOB|nr:DUF3618 domain-containing protein [Cognatiyoonia koreensis]SEW19348.1 Protein of unknown function [Cognatiyoonia koreensis]